jgi:hypothetical protein
MQSRLLYIVPDIYCAGLKLQSAGPLDVALSHKDLPPLPLGILAWLVSLRETSKHTLLFVAPVVRLQQPMV